MDAIRNLKTMAGSPDVETRDTFALSVSPSCAWFFRFGARPSFREPMKDPYNV
jgi:hypothetical protein